MSLKNYYLILGVDPNESPRGIRAAYRDLAKRFHPDLAGPEGKRRFEEVTEAYEVLSDPERRQRYDEKRRRQQFVSRGRESFSLGPEIYYPDFCPPPEESRSKISLFADPESIRPSFEALYQRIYRNFGGVGVPKGEGLEALNIEVLVSEREAREGTVVPIGVPTFYACSYCKGTGREWLLPCMICGGRGLVEDEDILSLEIPPFSGKGLSLEVPLSGLAVRNLFLRVHVRVSAW